MKLPWVSREAYELALRELDHWKVTAQRQFQDLATLAQANVDRMGELQRAGFVPAVPVPRPPDPPTLPAAVAQAIGERSAAGSATARALERLAVEQLARGADEAVVVARILEGEAVAW